MSIMEKIRDFEDRLIDWPMLVSLGVLTVICFSAVGLFVLIIWVFWMIVDSGIGWLVPYVLVIAVGLAIGRWLR
jgi:uncharacterized membrane protein YqjE